MELKNFMTTGAIIQAVCLIVQLFFFFRQLRIRKEMEDLMREQHDNMAYREEMVIRRQEEIRELVAQTMKDIENTVRNKYNDNDG